MYRANKHVPCKEDVNRNIARHRSSRLVELDGDDAIRSGIPSAALDGVLGHGTASVGDDGDGLDGTTSQRQSASAAAESPASVDCGCSHYKQNINVTSALCRQSYFDIPWTRMWMGDCALLVAGPRAWNALPADIRCAPSLDSFKKRLKSHLFSAAYEL